MRRRAETDGDRPGEGQKRETMSTKTYTIDNCNGIQCRAWSAAYEAQSEAAEAVRVEMCWPEIVLSDDYAVNLPDDAETGRQRHGRAWSCYPSQEACDADRDGARAPRVVEA